MGLPGAAACSMALLRVYPLDGVDARESSDSRARSAKSAQRKALRASRSAWGPLQASPERAWRPFLEAYQKSPNKANPELLRRQSETTLAVTPPRQPFD